MPDGSQSRRGSASLPSADDAEACQVDHSTATEEYQLAMHPEAQLLRYELWPEQPGLLGQTTVFTVLGGVAECFLVLASAAFIG
jgi:hypothetical protein